MPGEHTGHTGPLGSAREKAMRQRELRQSATQELSSGLRRKLGSRMVLAAVCRMSDTSQALPQRTASTAQSLVELRARSKGTGALSVGAGVGEAPSVVAGRGHVDPSGRLGHRRGPLQGTEHGTAVEALQQLALLVAGVPEAPAAVRQQYRGEVSQGRLEAHLATHHGQRAGHGTGAEPHLALLPRGRPLVALAGLLESRLCKAHRVHGVSSEPHSETSSGSSTRPPHLSRLLPDP